MRMGGLAVFSSRLMPSSVSHKTEINVLERERNLFIFFWASAALLQSILCVLYMCDYDDRSIAVCVQIVLLNNLYEKYEVL